LNAAVPWLIVCLARDKVGLVLAPQHVILGLKMAVLAVTLLLVASLAAVALGRYRLHGRINRLVFVLTLAALLGLEGLARLVSPGVFQDYFDRTGAWEAFYIHLGFAVPTAVVLLAMLVTGLGHRRRIHIRLGFFFLVLWTGTFITGIFFLPHKAP
jgi:hypothetical protein